MIITSFGHFAHPVTMKHAAVKLGVLRFVAYTQKTGCNPERYRFYEASRGTYVSKLIDRHQLHLYPAMVKNEPLRTGRQHQ